MVRLSLTIFEEKGTVHEAMILYSIPNSWDVNIRSQKSKSHVLKVTQTSSKCNHHLSHRNNNQETKGEYDDTHSEMTQ